MGLGEVCVKGRGGPNAAQWPLCVRPQGFYGVEPGGDDLEGEGKQGEPEPEDEQTKIRKQVAKLLRRADRDTLEDVGLMAAQMMDSLEQAAAEVMA
jgi:hypothetical protein